MPQKRNSAPPKVMMWGRATPVLAVSAIFDALRLMFEMFWFFGPALAALYCTITTSGTLEAWTFGLLGTKTAALVCTAGAGLVGAVAIEMIAPFGVIMAMAVGFAGWLTVGIILLVTNGRIFKENALWFAGSLLVSEIPIVGSVPVITLVVWKMYRTQIRVEKEQAASQLQQQNRRMARLLQDRAETEAADDEWYEQAHAEGGEYGIPEKAREAA